MQMEALKSLNVGDAERIVNRTDLGVAAHNPGSLIKVMQLPRCA